jgi:hypothetical protein
MDTLSVDLNYTSGEAGLINFKFRIQVYLRGTVAEPNLVVLHSNSALISVTLGCYYPSYLNMTRTNQDHPRLISFNSDTNVLTMIQPQSEETVTSSLDLTDLVRFTTNYT